jgi:signal transduction histidine kinase
MKASGILLGGMIGLFALALGYIVIFVLYQRRMISKDLQQQKLENDYQKKLLQSAIDNQEAERKRIAHDLHDEIGALLTTSRLYFNQLSPGHAEEQLKIISHKVNHLFDEMMANIRRISHDLRPIILENLGLIEAIEGIRDKLTETGVDFHFTHQFTFRMTRDAELILYRIIQEFVNNTLKHAKASRIDLSMEMQGDQLKLIYADNGIGFTSSTKPNGLGLKSIESRLSLMEASMQVNTSQQGVRFIIYMNTNKLTVYEKH